MADPTADITLSQYSWLREESFLRLYDGELGAEVAFHDFAEPVEIPASDRDIPIVATARTRLDLLAYQYYGTPYLWWVIAQRNEMDNPVAEVYPGRRILVPDPDAVRARLSL